LKELPSAISLEQLATELHNHLGMKTRLVPIAWDHTPGVPALMKTHDGGFGVWLGGGARGQQGVFIPWLGEIKPYTTAALSDALGESNGLIPAGIEGPPIVP
jgi:hypothetical protein